MDDLLKVLLIEDNPGDAFLIKFYLGESISHKFDFSHVDTLEGAFNTLREKKFDIILMDLNLPDSNGLDSVKKLIEVFPNNLVIVLTGLIDERVGLEAVRYGAQDFLVKGKFDSKGLVSSIVFSHERFSLNKKLFNVSSELNLGEERLQHLQELTGIGYAEIDIKSKTAYISTYILDLVGHSRDLQYMPLDVFCEQMFVNGEENIIKELIEKGEGEGEQLVQSKSFGKPVLIKWKYKGDKILGVVYYNQIL